MTHSEQQLDSDGEQLMAAPELFEYITVLDALEEHQEHDDIAYVCGVIFDWKHAVTPWSYVTEARTLAMRLELISEETIRAKKLLEQSSNILADEHWLLAQKIEQEVNAYLEAVPGAIHVLDSRSGVQHAVTSVALSVEHTDGARLFVSGDEGVVEAGAKNLQVYVDRKKLQPDTQHAVAAYVAALEIQPGL